MREKIGVFTAHALILLAFFGHSKPLMALDTDAFFCQLDLDKVFKSQKPIVGEDGPSHLKGAIELNRVLKANIDALIDQQRKQVSDLKSEIAYLQIKLTDTLEKLIEFIPPNLNPENNGMPGFKLKIKLPKKISTLLGAFRNLSLGTLSLEALVENFSKLIEAKASKVPLLTPDDIQLLTQSFEEIELLKTEFALLSIRTQKSLEKISSLLDPTLALNESRIFESVDRITLDPNLEILKIVEQSESFGLRISETLEGLSSRFKNDLDKGQLLSLALGNVHSARLGLKEKIDNHLLRIRNYGFAVDANEIEGEVPHGLVNQIFDSIEHYDSELAHIASRASSSRQLSDKQIEAFLGAEDSGIFPRFVHTFGGRVSQVQDPELRQDLQSLITRLEREKFLIFSLVKELRNSSAFGKLQSRGGLNGDLAGLMRNIQKAQNSVPILEARSQVSSTRKFVISFTLATLAGGSGIYYFLSSVFAND